MSNKEMIPVSKSPFTRETASTKVKVAKDVWNSRDPEQGVNKAVTEHLVTSRVAEPPDIGPGYRLAARGRQEAEDDRLSLLERIFDPLSCRRRGLVRPGWRCLEVGAGRGSMAVWLAKQVGKSGKVVATDIDVTYLNRLHLPNLEVRQHNILEDSLDALGPGSFDLVCSRLTLFWLAGKQEMAIRRMVECLRPGGWLVDEDGDWGTLAPVDPSHPYYARYQGAYGVANGGHRAGTTPPLDASYPRFLSVAAWKTSVTKRRLKSYAGAAPGRGGGRRHWRLSGDGSKVRMA